MPEKGWTKPGAKYVKRIPKPGGGFYYLYPEDIKRQAAAKLNKIKGTIAEKTGKGAAAAKTAVKKGVATAADKIGLDERAAYKQSQKQTNPLKRAYAKNRYDETIAGKVERAAKPLTDKIGKGVATAKAMSGKNKVNRTSYEDLDGRTTHYVGQKGKKKVFKTGNKFVADMYEGDKKYINTAKAIGKDAKREFNNASKAFKNVVNEDVQKLKKGASKTARALTIDDDIARAKKKAKVNKAKKKVDKAIKKVKKSIKK